MRPNTSRGTGRGWRGKTTDPIPPSRGLVACAVLAGLAALALTPLATQGVVVFAQTGTFAWPTDPVAALAGILRGQYGTGLPADEARHLPGSTLLTILSLVVAVVTATGLAALARLALGPGPVFGGSGPMSGLGTRREARDALSAHVLRRRAAVIRPDLYRRRSHGRKEIQ